MEFVKKAGKSGHSKYVSLAMDREESALDVDLADGSHIRIGNNSIREDDP